MIVVIHKFVHKFVHKFDNKTIENLNNIMNLNSSRVDSIK